MSISIELLAKLRHGREAHVKSLMERHASHTLISSAMLFLHQLRESWKMSGRTEQEYEAYVASHAAELARAEDEFKFTLPVAIG